VARREGEEVADIVTLGVEVQTKGAAQSAQQLGQFTTAAKSAAGAADTLENQLNATAAAQTKAASAGRPLAGAMQGIGTAFKNNSSSIQNASFQISDLIVQMEMGVPASRALGQQLPQLLGGFGPLGAVLGVATGALLTLAPALLGSASSAKTLQETIDELSDSIGAMRDLSSELANLDQLAERYGAIDAELVQLLGHMREQQELAVQNQALAAISAISEEYKVAAGAVNLFKITGQGAAADVAAELGLTQNAFLALQAAIREAETATTLEAQASAVAKIADQLSRATGANADLVNEAIQTALRLREAAQAGQDLENVNLEGALGGAANQASRIADELGRAASNAISAAANSNQARREAEIRLQFAGNPAGQAGAMFDLQSGIMQGSQDMGVRMQFESLRQETVDNAAATAEAQAQLATFNNTLRSSGTAAAKVDQEVAKLTETFDPFQKLVEGVAGTIESELNSAFASVLDGTKTLGEALLDFASNVLAQVAQDLFAQQFSKPIAAGIAGIFAADGRVFNSAGVTPFAKGGVVGGPTIFPFANGIGLMGEAGPEAIMPLARGADGKLGVSAANGNSAPNVIINNYSGQEATASSDSAGNLVVEIGRAIAQDITSGGPSYRAIRTTFGLGGRLQQRG
jgi:lambda family phage tail tape measure protein